MSTALATPAGDGFMGSENMGGFAYGIGVSVGILLIIITITLASYYCTRASRQASVLIVQRPVSECRLSLGLDEATLLSYPNLLYSQAKVENKLGSTATCCSICLADYKGSDTLRLLPDCGHLFHIKCVDPWLRQNPTCPVCRTSPLPTPMATPLAEVVPIASRPMG